MRNPLIGLKLVSQPIPPTKSRFLTTRIDDLDTANKAVDTPLQTPIPVAPSSVRWAEPGFPPPG
jgi:hypothetical protein